MKGELKRSYNIDYFQTKFPLLQNTNVCGLNGVFLVLMQQKPKKTTTNCTCACVVL